VLRWGPPFVRSPVRAAAAGRPDGEGTKRVIGTSHTVAVSAPGCPLPLIHPPLGRGGGEPNGSRAVWPSLPLPWSGIFTMKLSAARARSRLAAIFVCCLTVTLVCLTLAVLPAPAHAQQDAGANPAPAPAAPAAPAAPSQDKTQSIGYIFWHILTSLGWVFGFILAIVSISLVALVVLLAMDLRMGAAIPPGFVEEFTETVNKRQFKAAYDLAKTDESFLGRVLTTGMSRLQYGIEDAREAAFNMVESIKSGKEQIVSYLAVIGTLGPLLGLVGTVWGMILAFITLAEQQPSFSVLAGKISHALVVTLFGIGLSVPAIFCHTFFKNRLTRISMDTANVADDLLTQMYHNSKKPAPSGTTPTVEATPVPTASVKSK
jgi:biopolymer transport protein ExbB